MTAATMTVKKTTNNIHRTLSSHPASQATEVEDPFDTPEEGWKKATMVLVATILVFISTLIIIAITALTAIAVVTTTLLLVVVQTTTIDLINSVTGTTSASSRDKDQTMS